MDPERNRRLNELIAERDVVAAAALLQAEGYDEAEAIDLGRALHRAASTPTPRRDGYPAAYAQAEGASGGGFFRMGRARPIGFETPGPSRPTWSETAQVRRRRRRKPRRERSRRS